MATQSLSLTNGLASELDAIASEILELQPTLDRIEAYFARNELDGARVAPDERRAMAERLNAMPLLFDDAKIATGQYDEYFAIAYQDVHRGRAGKDDPIDAIRTRSSADWDFVVDTFDEPATQGIIVENIRAAGALDYIHALGEKAGMFLLTDALVHRWVTGQMDLEPGALQGQLYRYFKLRDERMSPEERGVVYRRVLAKGTAKLVRGMVLNDDFPRLWEQLLREFADYIGKVENTDDQSMISPSGIYEATHLLQVNLTERMTGMALMQVREMHAQLQEAREILSAPEIANAVVGGRRRNMWAVLETLAREELQISLNTAALRTEAVDGNRLFSFVANFDRTTVTGGALRAAAESAKSYIYAQAALGKGMMDEEHFSDGEDPSQPSVDNQDFEDF